VGRAPGCGVSLPEDTFISQLHARVFRRDGSLFVEDLGSTNGTFLNRKAVSAAVPLRKGDRLQVGKTVLEVAK
jgi:pSer/pThr/pTyr-binding forkhead associated (FHA) protein